MSPAEPLRKQRLRMLAPLLCFAALVSALVLFRGGAQRFFQELDPVNANHVCFDGQQPKLMCDFANVYYPQGVSLRESAQAVRGFYYSPFFGVGMRLLAVLPFAMARGVWLAIVLGAVAVVASLPALLGLFMGPRGSFAYVLVLATSLPLLHDLFSLTFVSSMRRTWLSCRVTWRKHHIRTPRSRCSPELRGAGSGWALSRTSRRSPYRAAWRWRCSC